MSFIVSRDGSISLFRVGTLIAVLGVLLIGGGILAYVLDQNSYKAPLEVEVFPNAESWGGARQVGTTRRTVFLASNTTPEEVVRHYESQQQSIMGGDATGCTRVPATGSVEGAAQDNTIVPYSFKCLFQRTGVNASQHTLITIQPGVFNTDPELNTVGKTVIEHDQRWQP